MRTFAVSDVSVEEKPLAEEALADSLRARAGEGVEAAGSNLPLVRGAPHGEPTPFDVERAGAPNGFLQAVHTAFASHYPLTLSPDDVWLCIAQGFGIHVTEYADELRGRIVRHEGKQMLRIRRDRFVKGAPENDWPGCFAELSDGIAEHIGKKRDLVVADFSTTGGVEKAASEVVLMSAMASYFEYRVMTLCGIPRITLLGDEADWRSIRRRAAVLSEFGLAWWVDALLPVLDRFVDAACGGAVDRTFWSSFYKEDDKSGGPYTSGWINVLFPYLQARDRDGTRSAERNGFVRSASSTKGSWSSGPGADDFPSGLSQAPFVWEYLGSEIPMELLGGFVGVGQDPATGGLRPAIGWAVRQAG